MTSTSAVISLPVLTNLPERCCQPGQCAYSPSRVRSILHLIRNAPRYGDDPAEAAASYFSSKDDIRGSGGAAGGSGLAHGGLVLVADVEQAIAAIGGRPSAEAISAKLCPYGPIDEG